MSVLQQWADIVDNVSDPSTDPDAENPPSERRSLRDDLLNPPDGGYPFIEWEDIPDHEKAMMGLTMLGDGASQAGVTGHPLFVNRATGRVKTDAPKMPNRPALKDMVARVVIETVEAIEADRKKASTKPQPAKPGHLMAEGSMLRIAQEALRTGNRMPRKVSFTEPVNAFTCLHGDSLARGGDMLTAVTICDTEPVEVKDHLGNVVRTMHEAKAVTT